MVQIQKSTSLPNADESHDNTAEGGCGVIGVACSVPVQGKYLLQPLLQMHNRGNGKGGGIAAVGLDAEQMGVTSEILEENYILQVAYLDPSARPEVEAEFIEPQFNVNSAQKVPTLEDYQSIGLEVEPPEVWRYFVRVKEDVLSEFIKTLLTVDLEGERAEDEFVYRNSFALNKKYYASLGEKKAFVVSHGKNMLVLKIVGYAEDVIRYYLLEDLKAHVWIGHQRYPTKGRVWHPGGSHPFIGLHDALVHNGDFANYYSICDYLKQKDLYPLFLTDTEVAVIYWDLLTRGYDYPLEYAIEAIAPTTERDFVMLPEEKKALYRTIQATHMHGSPDGPWFFIIARNEPHKKVFQLLGITDTSMLRPQVFALQEGSVKLGLIASEKQAIDAMVSQLARDDDRFYPVVDKYWYARGGSYTDGGAFIFTVDGAQGELTCTDKFGQQISTSGQQHYQNKRDINNPPEIDASEIDSILSTNDSAADIFATVSSQLKDWDFDALYLFLDKIGEMAKQGIAEQGRAIETLTLLIDRRYDTGQKKRSDVVATIEEELFRLFSSIPPIDSANSDHYCRVTWQSKENLREPADPAETLVIDVVDFQPEGKDGPCQFLDHVYQLGWRNIIAYNFKGQRNFAAGLIARDQVRIDIYGRVGDCLAAFADGPEIYVHECAQDSVAYCFRSGKLVIYGDAGKAFEYGAKGGVTYVLGDLIDRPLINSVGSATALINGQCKDYLGESCMAAKGFIILNGIGFNENGQFIEKETPYPGGNLFPLAAASAVYLRDPRQTVGEDQLNGATIVPLTPQDWEKILPKLEENEKLFGISIETLLTVDGIVRNPEDVYRKVTPVTGEALGKYDSGM
ncbi:MAG TPA: glutamate synthase [Candidatus Lokiarchaeia archaeon]|nr:glutamate synthase [Candidatus Lokiarchaeia archaeon]